ncbi:MAG: DUF4340 domain-containing protein [Aphanocapsa sp. GSE-SYN-MK-11-07L]|jgi:hypothetical protein|nr:DUF4340 domain-containing protein [Aphanocapsa sp. GSE-SYN-MK-11-07L]
MKLQSKTLILALVAAVMAGGVYFYQRQSGDSSAEQSEAKPLFSFKEADVQSLTVKTSQQTVVFERSPTKFPRAWQFTSPQTGPANEAAIAYLLNLLATESSDRSLTVPATQQKEFGLQPPKITIEVKLANQQTHRLILGNPTFDQTKLYAATDPPASTQPNANVQIVSLDFANAVNRPLAEWQAPKEPPKANPPPTPLPTASPLPSP